MPKVFPRPINRVGQKNPIPPQAMTLSLDDLIAFLFGQAALETLHVQEVVADPLKDGVTKLDRITPRLLIAVVLS
jgi:hypothetical protein